jgi:alanyl-tRNA synthetase
MKLEQIRSAFLNYFGSHQHNIAASSPLVPHNDPTLMFTNAGMVQFKNIFTGKEAATNPPRAATAQKCVRAGGKHNDLDNVGYTARHHTFFEMMGNFSFADYFKEEAIYYAWNLLTKEFGLNADKLYTTVYHDDDEAFELWKKIAGLPDSKIMRIPTSDNFWAMGDTGPCGPCSEIFYDHGAGAAKGEWSLNADYSDNFGDRFIEIWNLVFMQYEQVSLTERITLPKPSIDTGMGLERMAAVLQGKHDNYSIDLFDEIIIATQDLVKTKITDTNAASFKVIADHLRSSCFLLADGVMPSNEGRGYVLRRIMRRGMRHAHMLGATQPVMYQLVDNLLRLMGGAYPELGRAEAMIKNNLRLEEERFRETLGRGLKLLEEASIGIASGETFSGEIAFKLYDTYGFPLDLTQDILRGQGMTVDINGFNTAMAEQKARARAAWKGSGASATADIWLELYDKLGATEFLGYTQSQISAKLIAIVKNGSITQSAATGETVELLFNQTVAYAESGGQSGDSGELCDDDGKIIGIIHDVKSVAGGLNVHNVELKNNLSVNANLVISYDLEKRLNVRANHSATHLLHAALRESLGAHVTQKGSLVTHEKLRFDFSHNEGLNAIQIAEIERRVNEMIWHNDAVSTRIMTPDAAIESGAMALFGEKYSDEVRVLSMGAGGFSVELCGGTHVERTGDIGLFKIISETAIAAGVRRIEAVTRSGALNIAQNNEIILKKLAGSLVIGIEDLQDKVNNIIEERKNDKREIANLSKNLALKSAQITRQNIGDVNFIGGLFYELDPKELRGVATDFQNAANATITAVASNFEGKASIVVLVSNDLINSHNAVDYVRSAVEVVGGKGGGGKADFAQGGGSDGTKCGDALQKIAEIIAN